MSSFLWDSLGGWGRFRVRDEMNDKKAYGHSATRPLNLPKNTNVNQNRLFGEKNETVQIFFDFLFKWKKVSMQDFRAHNSGTIKNPRSKRILNDSLGGGGGNPVARLENEKKLRCYFRNRSSISRVFLEQF